MDFTESEMFSEAEWQSIFVFYREKERRKEKRKERKIKERN